MADVPPPTATEWRERGEGRHSVRPSTPALATFAAAIKKAEAQDEARRLLRINQAGQGGTVVSETTTTYPDGRVVREVKRASPQWQADAWHLERKWPDRYGRRLQADLTLLAGVTKLTVTAVDTAGHTGQDVLTITLMASPPPPGPITVIWAWSGGGETFQVERCTVSCGAMAAVAAVAITERQWTDTGVQPTSNYCYRLAVVTGGSRGPYSNTLCSQ
jgi:hypothetical protein